MRNFGSFRIWISAVALTIFILTGSASLSAQTVQNTGTDVHLHKFVPVVPPENSKFAATSSDATQVNAVIGQQVQLLMQDKASRTPAQRKIDSNVLYTIRMMHGLEAAPGVTSLYTGVDLDESNRIAVDIVADVTDDLLKQMESSGALILDSHRDYRAIRALVPADQIEILAASPSVSFIGRKVGSLTSRLKVAAPVHSATKAGLAPGFEERAARVRKQIAAYLQQQAGANSTGVAHGTGQGNVTTEGDAAHTSATARGVYGVSGVGLKIGVLSDSANNTGAVTTAQATGDMPPTCPGPGGPCLTILQDDPSGGSDEGAAMLEIVYDMAPGANLYFATADISESGFASNILALQTAGCNIIVDDVFYFDEPVFQDGIVAQAVTTVTGLGVNYFSSAGNEGNVAKNTAGYFEGDFNDNGSAAFTFPGGTKTGTIHNFGTVATPVNGDIITSTGEAYTLNWADPQGTSANDYDLFLVTSAGTVKSSSTNIQNGTQNPFEQITPPALVAGDRLVVFKVTGAASVAFAINTLRGTLTIATTGQTHGHSSATAAFSVAAAPAAAAFNGVAPVGPFPNAFTTANQVEPFTSDGPRRMFFTANGTPITPGNLLFGTNGGQVRVKPDITAADGVSTTLPGNSGLNPFYGTSAAAPAAASVAALIMSAKPAFTSAQVRTTLTTTALDVEGAGVDNISGNGIVMSMAALNSLGITGFADLELGTITASENPGNGNGILEAGEGGVLTIQLKNTNGVQDAKNISAVLTSTTPGVTITLPGNSTYPNLPLGTGTGTNVTPFTFTLASNFACGTTINFTLTLTYTNGPAATKVLNFSVPIVVSIANNLGGISPTGLSGGTFATGQQTGRISRTGVASVCGTAKANPGLTVATGSRQFDAYTFVPGTTGCMTVTMNSANGLNLGSVAYTSAGFTPADPSINYAADSGSSSATQVYGISVVAGSAVTLVVHDINVVPGSNSPYTLSFPACILSSAATVNHPPVAVAQNVTVSAATIGGTAAANINNGSSDPDAGDTITLSQNPPGPYPIGVTSVILTVTDSKGASAQATANVTVLNPPTISSLNPTTVVAGSGAFTLTVTGTNFVTGAVVNFNGAAKATSFQNSTQVSASILSTDVTTASTPTVTVTVPGTVTSNTVTFTVSGAAVPDLTITKTHVGTFNSGQVGATYTITATNSGSGPTTAAVTVVDNLPIGMTATAMAGTGWACTLATLTCTRADVLAATSSYPAITLTVNVSAAASTGSVINIATVSGGGETNTANDSVNDSTLINGIPDMTILKQHFGNFTQGEIGDTYKLTVTDSGGAASAGTVTVVDTLPTGLTATAISGTGWTCTLATLTCTRADSIGQGASYPQITLTVNVAANAPATVTNTATVSGGGETNTSNNTSSDLTTVAGSSSPDMTITKSHVGSFTQGQVGATYTITATNSGTGATTGTVTVVDTLPTGLTATGFTGTGWTCTLATVTCTRADALAPSAAYPAITLTVTVAANAAATVTNTVTVSGGGETNVANDSASDLTTVVVATAPDLTITKTHVGNFAQGQVGATYTITATNSGTAATTGTVTVVDTVPTGLTATALAGTGWTCTVATGTCTRTDALVAAGSYPAITLTVTVAANAAASVTNSVTISGGGETNTANDTATNPTTVTATTNPVPAITTISPSTLSAGSGAFTLTVNGSNFVSTSVVNWNGSPRVTTFVSATQLTAAITAADILTANLYSVTVFNPTPGGGTSNVVTFTATTPVPAITTLVPNSAIAGGAAFSMIVNGSNFINTSVVQWNGSNRVTTFVSSTQLSAAITAADILTAGTASVRVFTPTVFFGGAQPLGAPLGTTSNALTFTITLPNPVPTLTAISPTSAGAGGAGFTMTLTGTNFVSSSVAQWKGSARVTTFVSATQLTAAITAADIATAGTAAVTVFTPTPGGGTTAALTFTITDFSVTPTPTTQTVPAGASTTYSIAAAAVGGAFTGNVTFTASGFPTGAAGTFNPASVAPGSSTVLTVTTTARGLSQIVRPPSGPSGPVRPLWLIAFLLTLALASITLAKFGGRRVRRLIPIGAFALLLISAGYLSGCASSGFPKVGSNLGTPAGTYPITVTGTSGTNVHTTTVTLVVQ